MRENAEVRALPAMPAGAPQALAPRMPYGNRVSCTSGRQAVPCWASGTALGKRHRVLVFPAGREYLPGVPCICRSVAGPRRKLSGQACNRLSTSSTSSTSSTMSDSQNQWIIETTADTFARDVWERSQTVPVIVDFWAPWCQPCSMLAPILERVVEQAAGQVVLVKANVDQHPQAATEFQVSGIPAVFGVTGGNVVSFFQGAAAEAQIQEFVEQLLAKSEVTKIRNLESSAPELAAEKYREALQQNADDSEAAIGLARVLAQLQQWDACGQIISKLEERGYLEPEAETLRAQLELHQGGGDSLDELRRAAAANPDDLEAQLELGRALAGASQFQEALDVLLGIVEIQQTGVGDQARQLILDVFRVLTEDSELTREYRRKLSALLF